MYTNNHFERISQKMRWKWNANTWESRPYCPTETKHSNYTHSNLKQKLLNWAWTQISNEITINSNYESIIFNSSVMYLLRFNLLGQLIPQWLKCPSNLIRKIQKVQRYAQMTHRIKFTLNQMFNSFSSSRNDNWETTAAYTHPISHNQPTEREAKRENSDSAFYMLASILTQHSLLPG